MNHLSTAPIKEKDLARNAVRMVRRWGGVLEHPALSKLWDDQDLPKVGQARPKEFTLAYYQWFFGHDALKPTWFFISGVPMQEIPSPPMRLGYHTHQIGGSFRTSGKRQMSSRRRAQTPPALAEWLVAVARLVKTELLNHERT
jgi:hypothetical protein